MAEIPTPMPNVAAPETTAATAETTPNGSPPAPPGGSGTELPSIPEAEGGFRFVINRARFKYFDRRLSARGAKYADEPVRLSITPEALLCDLSSATIPDTTSVPYAESGAPTAAVSCEAPANLLRHVAKPNKKESGPKGKWYFEGSLVFIVNIEEKVICLLDEQSILRFSIVGRTPVRAAFPERTGTPTQCESMALRRALLAVKPAASRDDVRELSLCQIKIENAQAIAAKQQLFAQYCHPALAGLQFQIAERDINAVANLLTLTDATVTVWADDDGVLVEDQRTRFGFRPLPEPMPHIQRIAAVQPTYPFECDRDEFYKALTLASLVVSGAGTRVLQIGFPFVVQDRHVCLQAITEWRPNTYKCTCIPIRMATDREVTLLQEITPFRMTGEQVGDWGAGSLTRADTSILPSGPAEDEGAEPSVGEELPLLELGHYLHADVLNIVKAMSAPVLSCGFIPGRALFITGKTDEVDAMYAFAPEAQNQAHGLTPRRRR
ncbi:UNVERIFIED_ORG: hypothetical protein M2438_002029 [Methylobacterium sp. SuP10 SLI 274]|uniref:hypothetical protein n=1 Tax=Methylorubrum extorquens TaxID=408 RepID=UPI00209E67D5|nr:hypothetical protein [Methylorubrum extorquens]MDF9863243.1 hypothetical protein [Methylorubrum pseudosasae]MDH6636854.1 hypothetical protein [Methylobacterium sp. SuP10 SLI 274]MDH6666031.1 hypothetical protein [Methylorubrum zatmanii]MCP1557946.1 hypothetical protein [Methylorubrum extorquens]MDF9791551.1 hypothetical protein [Methylorubrum extorquens]